jgi:hypothetical protein
MQTLPRRTAARSGESGCRPLAATFLIAIMGTLHAQTIDFSGYSWEVRSGTGGPGPNTFVTSNVFLDANGYLHLKISHSKSKWTTAEVFTDAAFGFGTYQFKIIGRPDQFDTNVVLGLFNYTTPDIGPDGTNEIDIEFATWGDPAAQHGNWTVWPAVLQSGIDPTTHSYDTTLTGDASTHRFDWTSRRVRYESLYGLVDDETGLYQTWNFAPADYALRVPQHPLPVHMNLWLLQGNAPTDKLDVDITIAEFKFIPDCVFANGFDDGAAACALN